MTSNDVLELFLLLIATIFGLAYEAKRQRNLELSAKLEEHKLNEKLAENKKNSDSHFAGRTDSDVLDEAIRSGSEMPKPD